MGKAQKVFIVERTTLDENPKSNNRIEVSRTLSDSSLAEGSQDEDGRIYQLDQTNEIEVSTSKNNAEDIFDDQHDNLEDPQQQSSEEDDDNDNDDDQEMNQELEEEGLQEKEAADSMSEPGNSTKEIEVNRMNSQNEKNSQNDEFSHEDSSFDENKKNPQRPSDELMSGEQQQPENDRSPKQFDSNSSFQSRLPPAIPLMLASSSSPSQKREKSNESSSSSSSFRNKFTSQVAVAANYHDQQLIQDAIDEEQPLKLALLEEGQVPVVSSKVRTLDKKSSFDCWEQDEPGFTDVRTFGIKLREFNGFQQSHSSTNSPSSSSQAAHHLQLLAQSSQFQSSFAGASTAAAAASALKLKYIDGKSQQSHNSTYRNVSTISGVVTTTAAAATTAASMSPKITSNNNNNSFNPNSTRIISVINSQSGIIPSQIIPGLTSTITAQPTLPAQQPQQVFQQNLYQDPNQTSTISATNNSTVVKFTQEQMMIAAQQQQLQQQSQQSPTGIAKDIDSIILAKHFSPAFSLNSSKLIRETPRSSKKDIPIAAAATAVQSIVATSANNAISTTGKIIASSPHDPANLSTQQLIQQYEEQMQANANSLNSNINSIIYPAGVSGIGGILMMGNLSIISDEEQSQQQHLLNNKSVNSSSSKSSSNQQNQQYRSYEASTGFFASGRGSNHFEETPPFNLQQQQQHYANSRTDESYNSISNRDSYSYINNNNNCNYGQQKEFYPDYFAPQSKKSKYWQNRQQYPLAKQHLYKGTVTPVFPLLNAASNTCNNLAQPTHSNTNTNHPYYHQHLQHIQLQQQLFLQQQQQYQQHFHLVSSHNAASGLVGSQSIYNKIASSGISYMLRAPAPSLQGEISIAGKSLNSKQIDTSIPCFGTATTTTGSSGVTAPNQQMTSGKSKNLFQVDLGSTIKVPTPISNSVLFPSTLNKQLQLSPETHSPRSNSAAKPKCYFRVKRTVTTTNSPSSMIPVPSPSEIAALAAGSTTLSPKTGVPPIQQSRYNQQYQQHNMMSPNNMKEYPTNNTSTENLPISARIKDKQHLAEIEMIVPMILSDEQKYSPQQPYPATYSSENKQFYKMQNQMQSAQPSSSQHQTQNNNNNKITSKSLSPLRIPRTFKGISQAKKRVMKAATNLIAATQESEFLQIRNLMPSSISAASGMQSTKRLNNPNQKLDSQIQGTTIPTVVDCAFNNQNINQFISQNSQLFDVQSQQQPSDQISSENLSKTKIILNEDRRTSMLMLYGVVTNQQISPQLQPQTTTTKQLPVSLLTIDTSVAVADRGSSLRAIPSSSQQVPLVVSANPASTNPVLLAQSKRASIAAATVVSNSHLLFEEFLPQKSMNTSNLIHSSQQLNTHSNIQIKSSGGGGVENPPAILNLQIPSSNTVRKVKTTYIPTIKAQSAKSSAQMVRISGGSNVIGALDSQKSRHQIAFESEFNSIGIVGTGEQSLFKSPTVISTLISKQSSPNSKSPQDKSSPK